MTIEQYDTILLKNGCEGAVVEVFDNKDFLVDIGDDPNTWETIHINIDEVDSVISGIH